MEQKTQKNYTSAPLENIDLEQRVQKRLSDVSSFINSLKNI